MSAEPTATPSANAHAAFACAGVAIPTPTSSGRSVVGRIAVDDLLRGRRQRIARARDAVGRHAVDEAAGGGADRRVALGASSPAPPAARHRSPARRRAPRVPPPRRREGRGRSGRRRPRPRRRRRTREPGRVTMFAYVITATGTSSAASAIVASTSRGWAPRLERDARGLLDHAAVHDRIRNAGCPTSIASAPAAASARSSAASTPGKPPVT